MHSALNQLLALPVVILFLPLLPGFNWGSNVTVLGNQLHISFLCTGSLLISVHFGVTSNREIFND